MLKPELVSCVAKATGMSEKQCAAVIDMTLRMVVAVTDRGEDVTIFGFGVFRRKDRSPKRVLMRGEELRVPPRSKLTFHCARKLMREKNDSEETA